MVDSEETRVTARVTPDTLNKLDAAGYDNRAEAVRKGIDWVLLAHERETKGIQIVPECPLCGRSERDSRNTEGGADSAQTENKLLIEMLRTELDRAHEDKQVMKEMYQSHILQVQTLLPAPKKEKWWKKLFSRP